jgi:hypothetical protein
MTFHSPHNMSVVCDNINRMASHTIDNIQSLNEATRSISCHAQCLPTTVPLLRKFWAAKVRTKMDGCRPFPRGPQKVQQYLQWKPRLSGDRSHKGKAVPLHTHKEAQGKRRYSSYSFTTSALDGMSGQRHAPSTLYPRGRPTAPIEQEARWAPEPVWTQRLEETLFASAEDRTSITRSPSPLSDTTLTELPRFLFLSRTFTKSALVSGYVQLQNTTN